MTSKDEPLKENKEEENFSVWDLMAKKKMKEMANTNLRIKDLLDDDVLRQLQKFNKDKNEKE